MNELVVIRGLPGSGKSTLAKNFFPGYLRAEADLYFEKSGVYQFDNKLLSVAHCHCISFTEGALGLGYNVVVSNTLVTVAAVEVYKTLAEEMKTKFAVIACVGDYGSVHNVPADVMARMTSMWQDYPGEYVLQANTYPIPIRCRRDC